MAVTRATGSADALLAGYNLLLAAVWTAAWSEAGYAPWLTAAHLAAAALPWLFDGAGARLSRAGRTLRDVYPLIALPLFWTELGLLRFLVHAGAHDAPIAALDRAIFGVHLNVVWMSRMPDVWFSELMHFIYFAYYPLIFLPPLVLLAGGRREAYGDVTFRLLLAYVACYVLYILFPVDGPSHTMTRYVGSLSGGFFYRLTHGALHLGDSQGTAFPSSHVVGAVTIACVAWRWLGRGWATLFTLEAIGVVLSTVYTQNHFAIDSAAGVALALVVQAVVATPLLRRLAAGPRRPSVPILPSFEPTPIAVTMDGGRS